MHSTLNSTLLAGMLKEKRGNKGLRAVADEIGDVSPATLSRIEQGKIPDVDTFIKLCDWLGKTTDTFIINNNITVESSNKERLVAHLRADRELEQDTIEVLIKLISIAYSSTK